MKALVDTQCWLWWFLEPERLAARARRLMADRRNVLYLSAASAWEIAIKCALGKLRLPDPPLEYVPGRLAAEGMASLPIEQSHALHTGTLPGHHHDPFDRLLVAQAQLERLPIITADRQLVAYDVRVVWAGSRPPS